MLIIFPLNDNISNSEDGFGIIATGNIIHS